MELVKVKCQSCGNTVIYPFINNTNDLLPQVFGDNYKVHIKDVNSMAKNIEQYFTKKINDGETLYLYFKDDKNSRLFILVWNEERGCYTSTDGTIFIISKETLYDINNAELSILKQYSLVDIVGSQT